MLSFRYEAYTPLRVSKKNSRSLRERVADLTTTLVGLSDCLIRHPLESMVGRLADSQSRSDPVGAMTFCLLLGHPRNRGGEEHNCSPFDSAQDERSLPPARISHFINIIFWTFSMPAEFSRQKYTPLATPTPRSSVPFHVTKCWPA